MTFRSVLLARMIGIVNPASGQSKGREAWESFRAALPDSVEAEVHETTGKGDGKRLALDLPESDDAIVVAVGGDGTIQEVVDGLMRRPNGPLPLLPIATGTANVFARCLSISEDPAQLASIAAAGTAVELNVGRLSSVGDGDVDTHFVLAAGIGLSANIIDSAPRELKDKIGFAAYVWAMADQVSKVKPSRVRVTVDGQAHRIRSASLVISNVGVFGDGAVVAHPNSDPADGRLDLTAIRSRNWWGQIGGMLSVLLRRHREADDVFLAQATRFEIEATPPLDVQIDGELVGATPVEVVVAEHRLPVVGATLPRMPGP